MKKYWLILIILISLVDCSFAQTSKSKLEADNYSSLQELIACSDFPTFL